jgi:DNA modification methylase
MTLRNQILQGDCLTVLKTFPDESVDCCITSPPYWGLRDYGVEGQLGLEATPEEYVAKMVEIFREVKRVLRKEGTCWLNLGDSYCGTGIHGEKIVDPKYGNGRNNSPIGLKNKINGLKPKDLVGIPWRVAFALQAEGWYLRQDIIWAKPNPMPESVTDRCTKSHEYVFLLSKSQHYYFDNEAIKENRTTEHEGHRFGGNKYTLESCGKHTVGSHYISNGNRNRRSVWTITTKPFSEAHFATFPEDLIRPMILAGTRNDDGERDIVLDPFMGSGTIAVVAKKLGRDYLGIELNPEYIKIAERSIISMREPVMMNTIKQVQQGKQKQLLDETRMGGRR